MGSNRNVNEAKREEMKQTFTSLKEKLGGAQFVADKFNEFTDRGDFGITAANVNTYARGASMGTNSLREQAKKLLASLS